VARAHRHSPAAIRFIIEGSGAYTAHRPDHWLFAGTARLCPCDDG